MFAWYWWVAMAIGVAGLVIIWDLFIADIIIWCLIKFKDWLTSPRRRRKVRRP